MNQGYAILLDGGFVTKRLRGRLGSFPSPENVMAGCRRISARPELQPWRLLRIYFYDAPPAAALVTNPVGGRTINLGRTETFATRTRFLDELELEPDVALRKGELSVHGWRVRAQALREVVRSPRPLTADDLELNLEQKGVDLRIGLDIARLALRALVAALVVVTGDSDLVPAFKFARREGIRVFLDHLGAPVKRELKAHADLVL